jgi:hypothetical protein
VTHETEFSMSGLGPEYQQCQRQGRGGEGEFGEDEAWIYHLVLNFMFSSGILILFGKND